MAETPDCIQFTLTSERQTFSFVAGQFVTLGVEIDGTLEVPRVFSQLTVKPDRNAIYRERVAGGKVSNYLNDLYHLPPPTQCDSSLPVLPYPLDQFPALNSPIPIRSCHAIARVAAHNSGYVSMAGPHCIAKTAAQTTQYSFRQQPVRAWRLIMLNHGKWACATPSFQARHYAADYNL